MTNYTQLRSTTAMRLLRRVVLLAGLVLVVAAISVYFTLRADTDHHRDQSLSSTARFGAVQFGAFVDTVVASTRVASDPEYLITELTSAYPGVEFCAVGNESGNVVCDQASPRLADLADQVAANGAAFTPQVTVEDSLALLEIGGADVSLVAARTAVLSTDSWTDSKVTARVATAQPNTPTGEFVEADGLRQIAIAVPTADNTVVTATGSNDAELTSAQFYRVVWATAIGVIMIILATVWIYIDHRSLLERATIDQLTKLPNRSEFEQLSAEVITGAHRNGQGVAVMLIDLNEFKMINDTFGHAAGDEFLQIVASRLRAGVRTDEIVGRWGGDEFVLVLPGIDDIKIAQRRCEEVADKVSGRIRLDGADRSVRIELSAGVAVSPEHGANLEELIESADVAMYRAKREKIQVAAAGKTATARTTAMMTAKTGADL